MSIPILTTGRLILRPPVAEDAQAIAGILNIWEVTRWLTVVPFPYGRVDAEEYLDRRLKSSNEPYWVIEISGETMGAISLSPDLGFFLAPSAHGNGYMTQAACAVLDWRFSLSDEDVVSGYLVGNDASSRVQQKLGFQRTHEEVVRQVSTGKSVTVIKTALAKPEWKGRDV